MSDAARREVVWSVDEALQRAAAAWTSGHADQTVELCAQIVVAAPDNTDAFNLLGLALFALGRKADAKAALERATGISGRADLHHNLAVVHKSLEDFDAALSCYQTALRLEPDYAEAHANFGRLLREMGNQGGALTHLRRALDLGWRHPNLHADLALIFYERDQWEPALDHLTTWFCRELPSLTVFPDPQPRTYPAKELPFAAALTAIADVLEQAGLPFFLGDGTALGFVRDRDFIGFDKDIDLGMDDSVSRQRVLDALDASAELWLAPGSTPDNSDLLICATYRKVVAIDIFFYKRMDGNVVHGIGTTPRQILWRQSPFELRPVEFLGRTFNVPSPSERYLAELYGETWQTPDPDYCAFVTGDIVGSLPLSCRFHALMDLQRAIKAGKHSRAVNISERLLQRLPDDPGEIPLRAALKVFVTRFG